MYHKTPIKPFQEPDMVATTFNCPAKLEKKLIIHRFIDQFE